MGSTDCTTIYKVMALLFYSKCNSTTNGTRDNSEEHWRIEK